MAGLQRLAIPPALLAAVLFLGFSRPAAGHSVDRVQVLEATTDGPVRLKVEGTFNDACPRAITPVVQRTEGAQDGVIVVTLRLSLPPPGLFCPQVLTPFSLEVEVGYPQLNLPYSIHAAIVEGPNIFNFWDLAQFQLGVGDERGVVGVETSPGNPSPADKVTLTVHGLAIACEVHTLSLEAQVDLSRRAIRATLKIDIPPLLCPGRPVQFQDQVELGPLPEGVYQVDVELVATGDSSLPTHYPAIGSFEVGGPSGDASFLRGDANHDGAVNIADPIFTLHALFVGGAPPACPDGADADDSGAIDLSDAVFTLNFLFLEGAPPPAPGPDSVGPDPTPDLLDCPGA